MSRHGSKKATLAAALERAKKWMSENGAGVLVDNLAAGCSDAAIAKAQVKEGFGDVYLRG